MHIRAHGSLFDDGVLYRLAEEGEREGGSCPVGLFMLSCVT